MKSFFVTLAILMTALSSSAVTYDELAAKADRFYRHGEWLSALAMMHLMLDERPDEVPVQARAIVAAGMTADSVAQLRITRNAIDRHIPFDSLFHSVEKAALAQGRPAIYTVYLERVAAAEPWLARSIDSYLLAFYTFRRNPEGMIRYSRKMLDGMPDNLKFLKILADGYMTGGQWDNAVSVLDRILELSPDDTGSLLSLGNYYLATGDRPRALPYLRRAYDIHPTPYLEKILSEKE